MSLLDSEQTYFLTQRFQQTYNPTRKLVETTAVSYKTTKFTNVFIIYVILSSRQGYLK